MWTPTPAKRALNLNVEELKQVCANSVLLSISAPKKCFLLLLLFLALASTISTQKLLCWGQLSCRPTHKQNRALGSILYRYEFQSPNPKNARTEKQWNLAIQWIQLLASENPIACSCGLRKINSNQTKQSLMSN